MGNIAQQSRRHPGGCAIKEGHVFVGCGCFALGVEVEHFRFRVVEGDGVTRCPESLRNVKFEVGEGGGPRPSGLFHCGAC